MIPFLQNFTASIFWFLVVVGILVFLHEAGHFLTAKAFGIRVDVFSLGFGKRLFGRRRGETDYRVSLIPLGGYVKLTGGEEGGEARDDLPPDYFLARARWQRFLVLVMGAAVNIVLAVALFSLSFMVGVEMPRPGRPEVRVVAPGSPAAEAGLAVGDRVVAVNGRDVSGWSDVRDELVRTGRKPIVMQVTRGEGGERAEVSVTPRFDDSGIPYIGAQGGAPAIVGAVSPDAPAAAIGLQEDDEIVAIDGSPVADFTEVAKTIHDSIGRELTLTIRRGAERFDRQVTPVESKLDDGTVVGRIGFAFKFSEFVKLPPGAAVRRGVAESVNLAGSLFHVLKNLVTGNQPLSTLSGPIEIAKISRASADRGAQLLMWMAFISLQLGIINLLPIPMLDGGHIFILLAEGVMRRDMSLAIKERLNQIGFIFLVLLMGMVLFQDILKNI